MNSLKALRKVSFWMLVVLTVAFSFFLSSVVKEGLAKWPTTTWITLILWSVILCIHSYKKLQEAVIFVGTPKPSFDEFAPPAPEASLYDDLRIRQVYYLVGFGAGWFLFFYGGLGHDEYGHIDFDTPMAAFALKYFGHRYSSEGISYFSYYSWRHEILHYALSYLPIIILVCGGLIIYDLSQRRLDNAIKEHMATSSWH